MKSVIVAMQNVLVLESILSALKQKVMYLDTFLPSEHQEVVPLCKTICIDILVMNVIGFVKGAFDNRLEINVAKNQNLYCL